MKHKSFFLLLGALLFLFPSFSFAAQMYVNNIWEMVTGGDMPDLQVIVEVEDLSNGNTWFENPGWMSMGTSGIAMTNDYILRQTGDTLPNTTNDLQRAWYLSNNPSSGLGIKSLTLTGSLRQNGTTFTVFDIIGAPTIATPGSFYGILGLVSTNPVEATVDYMSYDEVCLQGGGGFQGDLYAGIKITFGTGANDPGYLPEAKTVIFFLDADRVTAVPIPGAYLLLGSGLLCLIGIKRRAR